MVGVITENKFNILTKEQQEGGDEGEKNNFPVQETKEDTPGVQMSDNKVTKSNNQENTNENDPIEVDSQLEKKDTTTSIEKEDKNNHAELEHNREVVVTDIMKGPELIEEEDEVLQHRKDTEEDEDMEYNIQQISKVGDLSPRHTNSLKQGARKGNKHFMYKSKQGVAGEDIE
ncbi:hypothetical protein H5410_026749 [Solanum commersonii]|uniref:Uncharacterized protein n=1 Tax=Solanum commersonii TaxID=4109 RepID=A0A9J5YXE1_SOLCO|nr:hypothetical protein H5410_026749 [Solanum commersonii]